MILVTGGTGLLGSHLLYSLTKPMKRLRLFFDMKIEANRYGFVSLLQSK